MLWCPDLTYINQIKKRASGWYFLEDPPEDPLLNYNPAIFPAVSTSLAHGFAAASTIVR